VVEVRIPAALDGGVLFYGLGGLLANFIPLGDPILTCRPNFYGIVVELT
jgi:hypothetical protein